MDSSQNSNCILGHKPKMFNSKINFTGKNNILFCEDGVELHGSSLNFYGNNSIIFLSQSQYSYKLEVDIYNDSVLYIGRDNFVNQKMTIILSEHKHCIIGDNGIYSIGICIRNSDQHLIYNCDSKERINFSESIFIGDHVWVGHGCMILKGSCIDSGSVIGAMSVVAGKKIPHNTSWGGNPCRQLVSNVFWDKASVHAWTREQTEQSKEYAEYLKQNIENGHTDYWIYEYCESDEVLYSDIEKKLNDCCTTNDRLEYLFALCKNKKKNRFVHKNGEADAG